MKIFIENFDPDDRLILCPFTGISWDGTYLSLKTILLAQCVRDEQIIPFKISVLTTKRELIYSHKVTHPDAKKGDRFFLFEDKKLIKSSPKLSMLFEEELKQLNP